MQYPDEVETLKPRWAEGPYGGYWDYDNPIIEPVPFRVWIQPVSSVENYDGMGSTIVISGYRLITPPGNHLEVNAKDKIRRVGESTTYEVVGEPAHWGRPLIHSEINLQIYQGVGSG